MKLSTVLRTLISSFWLLYFANAILGRAFYFAMPLIVVGALAFVQKNKITRDRYTIYLMLFLVSTFVSFAYPVGIDFKEYHWLIQPLLNISFFILINYITLRVFDLRTFVKHQVVVASLFFCILVLFTSDALFRQLWLRYTAGFNDPNGFTLLLLFIVSVSALTFKMKVGRGFRVLALLNVLFSLYLLLHTYSRSGTVAFAVFFLCTFLLSQIRLKYKLGCLILAAASLLYVYRHTESEMLHRLVERFELKPGSESFLGAQSRIDEIEAGLNLLSARPDVLLFGSGMGATDCKGWFKHYYFGIVRANTKIQRIHNTYFAMLVENGLLGVFLFWGYLALVFRKIRRWHEHSFLILSSWLAFLVSANFVWYLYFMPFWLGLATVPLLHIKGIECVKPRYSI